MKWEPKNLDLLRLELMKVLIWAMESKFIFSPKTLPSFNVVKVDDVTCKFYLGHLPIKIKLNANIDCVMSLEWSHVR